jgi:hypothetical protein
MTNRSIHSRIGRVLAVAVAGTVVGVTGALAVAADDGQSRSVDHHQQDRTAIAEWAKANDLSGLSPTSVSTADRDATDWARLAAEYRAIAEFIRGEGLSGLSPASVEPVDD